MGLTQRSNRHVGLAVGARRSQLQPDLLEGSKKFRYDKYNGNIPLDEDEKYARAKVENRPFVLVLLGYYAACKIFFLYLISLSSVITCALSIGLTVHWYYVILDRLTDGNFVTIGMDWVILGFAVVTPLSLSVSISFRRRERALIEISKFRSFAFQLLLAHAVWDWGKDGGKANVRGIDWLGHTDEVLTELIAVGDELSRFLTLPSTSRSRHRMTTSGRREAARTAEVAYRLYDSLYTQRMTRLSVLSEKVKLAGLGASEASRIRQYERWMGDAIENMRMIKTYRTPQTLRSFTRIFSTLLPPFFAPTFAQLGYATGNLGYGITFAIITSLCLNALVEGIDILEDPFVGFVTLDGIDVREEFQVLHYNQLVTARNQLYPDEKKYGEPNTFVLSEDIMDIDLEASSQRRDTTTPDTNNVGMPLDSSVESMPKTPRSHRKLLSFSSIGFGDANFLDGVDDISSRESGYTIAGRKARLHPFFNVPSTKEEEDDEGSSRGVEPEEVTATQHGSNQTNRKSPPLVPPPPVQPQPEEELGDEANAVESVDIVEDKDDEEWAQNAQNIQSNSDTLPRGNTADRKVSPSAPPPLASLFQPPLESQAQKTDDDQHV